MWRGRAFREALRVLRARGVFVYLGLHPCFASPFVSRDDLPMIRPGYRTAGWQPVSEASSTSVRAHVGINHLPLAALFNAVVQSGFRIIQVEEPGDEDPPYFLAIRATKP